MDDVYDKIKTLGGILNNLNDDKGLPLIKVHWKAGINEIGKHIKQAENVDSKSAAPKDKLEIFWFQDKVLEKNIGKSLETQSLCKVDSITIKIPLDSINNLGKVLEILFKEGEDEDVKKVDYETHPTYFMAKDKAGVTTKLEDLDL